MINRPQSTIDSLLEQLSIEGWAHNNDRAKECLAKLSPGSSTRPIDFSARKLPAKTKSIAFSFENNYYQAHRLIVIGPKRLQIWFHVDEKKSFWPEIERVASEKFQLARIDEMTIILIPKASMKWSQLLSC